MRKREAGFTLLESIAALVLTGMLLSMLSVVTRQFLSNWNMGAKRAEDVEVLALAAGRITDDLSGMVAIPGSDAWPALLFKGSGRRVYFLVNGNGPRQEGLYSIGLLAGEHGGLMRTSRGGPAPDTVVEDEWSENIRLLPDHYTVEFSYRKHGSGWISLWTEPALPEEIRVTLRNADIPSSEPWSFTVRPKAPWPAPCAHVAEFKECLSLSQGQPIDASKPQTIQKGKFAKPWIKNGAGP